MMKPLAEMKIAILVANGFEQNDMIAMQRAMLAAGANVRIVSVEQGLVNGWDGDNWGHNFAVDTQINRALAADFDCLVVPGGERSLNKLNLTAHTKRFVSGFMAIAKPVVLMGDAAKIMAMTENAAGFTMAGAADVQDMIETAGGTYSAEYVMMDRNIFSANTAMTDQTDDVVKSAMAFLTECATVCQEDKNAA
ncbi:MAG: DJ-1/PfpI family protein [Alphaproteobacteria bacterium]|jgi:protease I|nr:DJ-1/PfpI family protein [Alphaproteobacteria bacterium]MDP7222840.1 DJ-1/PfpI family protein [Alphaproteobacteria bacterium]